MDAAGDAPRTGTGTCAAVRARNIAACPAELPLPITTTTDPPQNRTSRSVAAQWTPMPSNSASRSTAILRYCIPVATTTAMAQTCAPSSSRTCHSPSARRSSPPAAPARPPVQPGRASRQGKAGAELHRLHFAPPAQIRAGNAGGKAHAILDPAGRPGLAADGHIFDHQRAQPLGPGMDARRHPCRTAANDDHVNHLDPGDIKVQPQPPCQRARAGRGDDFACTKDHRRSRRATLGQRPPPPLPDRRRR